MYVIIYFSGCECFVPAPFVPTFFTLRCHYWCVVWFVHGNGVCCQFSIVVSCHSHCCCCRRCYPHQLFYCLIFFSALALSFCFILFTRSPFWIDLFGRRHSCTYNFYHSLQNEYHMQRKTELHITELNTKDQPHKMWRSIVLLLFYCSRTTAARKRTKNT